MSHFCVFVIGEGVASILQPFHEFECTDIDDQYIVDKDVTEDARTAYAEAKEVRLRDPEGALHCPYDKAGEHLPQFAQEVQDALFPKLTRKALFVPEGWERVEVPVADSTSFAAFVKAYFRYETLSQGAPRTERHRFGYCELSPEGEVVRVVTRTNPNAKWDWWTVGGRYEGRLILRSPGAAVNSARKGDIDWLAMRQASVNARLPSYDKFHSVLRGRPMHEHWDAVRERMVEKEGKTIDAARDYYHAQPLVQELMAAEALNAWDASWQEREYSLSRDEFAQRAADAGIAPFAIVSEDGWQERGDMGWWGVVTDERADWDRRAAQLLEALPDTARITVVDCHI